MRSGKGQQIMSNILDELIDYTKSTLQIIKAHGLTGYPQLAVLFSVLLDAKHSRRQPYGHLFTKESNACSCLRQTLTSGRIREYRFDGYFRKF